MTQFESQSCVRGFHVYRSVWTLSCSRETSNLHDLFAKDGRDSHLPRRISSLCSSSVSESKRTDSEPSLAVIQHFTFKIMYVRTRVESTMCVCAHTT